MKRIRKAATIAAVLMACSLAMATSGSAQRGARGGGGAVGGGIARAPVVRVPQRIGTPLNPNFTPISRGTVVAPGLGLSYTRPFMTRRVYRDQRGRLRSIGFISPLYGPYYDAYPYSSYDDSVNYEAQPTDQTAEQAGGQTGEQNYEPAGPADQDAYAAAPQAPVPDVGQFILVRRDGQVALAVGFTTSGDRLTYITTEGIRRSFPTAELDIDATKQMNDANGTTITLPQERP